jgi:hypothetical protein
MAMPGKARDEQSGNLIANQLFNHGVEAEQDTGGGIVKSIDQSAEVVRAHALCQASRAAYIREQHGQLNLCAALMLAGKLFTDIANLGVEP